MKVKSTIWVLNIQQDPILDFIGKYEHGESESTPSEFWNK